MRSLTKMFRLILIFFSFYASGDINNGAYMVKISGCADCHTADPSAPMAGGLKLPSPFGIFYTPNITPDVETGIGSWAESDFITALRMGKSPSGDYLYPAFPYRSYTKLSDADLHDMYLYLKSLKPVKFENFPHQIGFPYNRRGLLYFWQELYFGSSAESPIKRAQEGVGPFVAVEEKSPEWNRGAYLVEAAAHCTECHTPRNSLGGLESSLWMAGVSKGLTGSEIPNITPDPQTGLRWSKQDWFIFLSSGLTPERHTPGQEMADVILNTSYLTPADRAAMAEYLHDLQPVRHKP
jgi:mono/diheme cytochrome c family protein